VVRRESSPDVRRAAILLSALVIGCPGVGHADLARRKEVRRTAAWRACHCRASRAPLVRALDARRAMRADLAYCRLAKMGSRAVDALLAKAGASAPYAQEPTSSRSIHDRVHGGIPFAKHHAEGEQRSRLTPSP
jgi:hypothetical protein